MGKSTKSGGLTPAYEASWLAIENRRPKFPLAGFDAETLLARSFGRALRC